jgi:hypothetical protein
LNCDWLLQKNAVWCNSSPTKSRPDLGRKNHKRIINLVFPRMEKNATYNILINGTHIWLHRTLSIFATMVDLRMLNNHRGAVGVWLLKVPSVYTDVMNASLSICFYLNQWCWWSNDYPDAVLQCQWRWGHQKLHHNSHFFR